MTEQFLFKNEFRKSQNNFEAIHQFREILSEFHFSLFGTNVFFCLLLKGTEICTKSPELS